MADTVTPQGVIAVCRQFPVSARDVVTHGRDGHGAKLVAILEEAGSSMDKIVSVTIVMADEDDFAGMNEEWLKWFPANPPARQGAKLPARIPGLKVSIAAIAEA